MITPFPVPEGSPAPSRPRVLFYSHDSVGLGHIRRTLSIAGELARRRPDASLLVLTGSFEASSYQLPPNLDLIKLPAYIRHELYTDVPRRDSGGRYQFGIVTLRDALIHEVAIGYAPHLVVVDAMPDGPNGELLRTLNRLRLAHPPVRLVAGLRDITSDAHSTRQTWQVSGVDRLLEYTYDHILIYGSQEIFDPVLEYAFTPRMAAKTQFTGYLAKDEPLVPATEIRQRLGVRDQPLIVVTAGGGYDGQMLIPAYLDALATGDLDGLRSFVVTGPYLALEHQARIERAAQTMTGVTLTPFTPEFLSYVNAADLVITMAGYNSICEVVSLGKRAIVVPRVRRSEQTEQQIRAERFAQRGLVSMLRPDELTPERLARLIRDRLSSPPPVSSIDFGGLKHVGEALSALLP